MRKNASNKNYYKISIEELMKEVEISEDKIELEKLFRVIHEIKRYNNEFGVSIKEINITKVNALYDFFKLEKSFTKDEILLVKRHVENAKLEEYMLIISEIIENNDFSYRYIKEKYGDSVFKFIESHRDSIIINLDDKFSPQRELDTSIYYLDDTLKISRINLYEELTKNKL